MSQKKTIVYVTRDIERALGAEPSARYLVVANRTEYAEKVKSIYPGFVHLVEGATLDTPELLRLPIVRDLMNGGNTGGKASKSGGERALLVFKNNPVIESIATENGWTLLNPPSALAEKIENKITQVEALGGLAERYLPEHIIAPLKDIVWKKNPAIIPLVIQWAHSHTGDGTILINTADELAALQKKFPDRLARASAFLNGPSFTMNVSVGETANSAAQGGAPGIALGNISYQITGLPPFTDNPFTTVGNDWSLTHSLLNDDELVTIETMAREIAQALGVQGWRGLFGIDFMRDDERGGLKLIEINARQPASTTYESQLQREYRAQGLAGITIFETHLAALDGGKTGAIIPLNDGAQIVQRVTKAIRQLSDDVVGSLELLGYATITYENTDMNTDLLRIQSAQGVMETHGRLNKRGKEIADLLSGKLGMESAAESGAE